MTDREQLASQAAERASGYRLVIVESPYAGDVKRNVDYARRCLADCLRQGEAPFASHLLYTQPGVLNDADPRERAQGIEAGLAWSWAAAAVVVYTDLGITDGMRLGIMAAVQTGRTVEYRRLASVRPGTAPDDSDTWCNCQAIPGTVNYPGPWHERGGESHYPCSQQSEDVTT